MYLSLNIFFSFKRFLLSPIQLLRNVIFQEANYLLFLQYTSWNFFPNLPWWFHHLDRILMSYLKLLQLICFHPCCHQLSTEVLHHQHHQRVIYHLGYEVYRSPRIKSFPGMHKEPLEWPYQKMIRNWDINLRIHLHYWHLLQHLYQPMFQNIQLLFPYTNSLYRWQLILHRLQLFQFFCFLLQPPISLKSLPFY